MLLLTVWQNAKIQRAGLEQMLRLNRMIFGTVAHLKFPNSLSLTPAHSFPVQSLFLSISGLPKRERKALFVPFCFIIANHERYISVHVNVDVQHS